MSVAKNWQLQPIKNVMLYSADLFFQCNVIKYSSIFVKRQLRAFYTDTGMLKINTKDA